MMKNHFGILNENVRKYLLFATILTLPFLLLSFILTHRTIRSEAVTGDPDDNWSVFGKDCQVLLDFANVMLEKDGVLYVGDATAGLVSTWDGSTWSTLGGGVSGLYGNVEAMVFDGDNLYVGGTFTKAGNVSVSNIAKWDGTQWSALGDGLDGEVLDLFFLDGILYAGGSFLKAGSLTVNYIASWNGTEWRAYDDGVNSHVRAVCVIGDSIFIGGQFTKAGTLPVEKVACWNGSGWQAMGSGVNPFVLDMEIYKGEIYIASGNYRVVKWNGSNWVPFGSGVNNIINDLMIKDEDLYIGGYFNHIDGIGDANLIAKWDGFDWTPIGHSITGWVNSMVVLGEELVVSGSMQLKGTESKILRLTDNQWQLFCENDDRGIKGAVYALVLHDGDIYAGGYFKIASHTFANGLARYDGNYWQSIGAAGTINELTSKDNVLYATGNFNSWNGIQTHGIVQWNGIEWDSLGNGLGDFKNVLEDDGQYVYVAGSFILAGGLNKIARWDGKNWSALANGNPLSDEGAGYIYSMFADNGILYVGGYFSSISGVPARNIAKWDGTSWSAMGDGSYSPVLSIDKFENEIHIGTFAYKIPERGPNFFRWDGNTWHTLSSGLNGSIYALEPHGDGLYAGGDFTATLDGEHLAHIAKWNGSNWENLGSGTDGEVAALLSVGSDLVVGGTFTQAGGKYSSNIAVWGSQLLGINSLEESLSMIVYPNPASGVLHITLSDSPSTSEVEIMMYDLNGQLILKKIPTSNQVFIETNNLPPGIYFLTMSAGQSIVTKKVVVN